ncbi:MAG: hypothetical protein ABJF10_10100 [Chthoniobacter sp.]|uniref:hypothetical protein n=1 Tax=Chthoniobacter sp. TaxID=2510640 RepID=UPI0032ABC7B3
MNPSYYLQLFFHALCEWMVSFGVAYWVAQIWTQSPSPLVVRLARHPQRFWLAIAFGIAPPILGLLLWPVLLASYQSAAGVYLRIPISYALAVIYGVLVGLAASCCAAPATAEEPFRPARAGGVSAALIVASFLFGSFVFQPLLHMITGLVTAVAVLVVSRLCLGESAATLSGSASTVPSPRRSPAIALVTGFIPSALILGAIAVASSTNLGKDESNALLWICSIVSVFCCFGASIALFTRKTGGAIAGGILLMLLNAFIAFFFGCCASINLSNMH